MSNDRSPINLTDDDNSSRPQNYKLEYLRSGSQSSIPLSTWYRYQRKRREGEDASASKRIHSVNVAEDSITEMDVSDEQLVSQNQKFNASAFSCTDGAISSSCYDSSAANKELPATNDFLSSRTQYRNENEMDYSEQNIHSGNEIARLTTETKVTEDIIQDVHESMKQLAEDVDDENSAEEYNESEDEEDNYFKDASEDNDFLPINVEEDCINKEDILSEKTHATLEDMIAGTDFNTPLNIPASTSIGEILVMIIRFALVNALSFNGVFLLFCLINNIFDTPVLPNTKYFVDKLFYPKKWSTFHGICPQCRKYAGTFEPRKDRYISCNVCQVRIDVKNYGYQDFFVMMDPSNPIAELIQSNSDYYRSVVTQTIHKRGVINDIYDGKLYKDFVKNLSAADKNQYATTVFNTDGAPLFESSTCSIWPIYLMLNELPYNVRTKELVLAGLWFGKDKPDMDIFLTPFVQSMNKLATIGIQCIINGIERCIKVFTLVCCVDAVARAPVQGFVQFNAYQGCGQCLHPGEWVRNSTNSGCMKFPLLNYIPRNRNLADTIKHADRGTKVKPVYGVKSRSPLIDLIAFDLILGTVVDSMHLASGIGKQFAKIWFGSKGKVGLISRRVISDVDALLKNIKSPNQVGRLTRSLSEREFWKAREWENWILFYSMPILLHVLPPPFLMHWALFVEALYILLQAEIKRTELNLANKLLHQFVGETERLYSKVAMTFNVHSLLHLTETVYDWGPLWAHNAFAFEAENGELLKGIHSARGIHHQVCRRVSLHYSMIQLKKRVTPSFSVKDFCTYIGTSMVKKTVQLSQPRYFGTSSAVNVAWIKKLNLSPDSSTSYRKVVKNGCLFMSSKKSNTRSDNTYAKLYNGSYVKLNVFIVDRNMGKEYTLVQKLVTMNGFGNECQMLQKIVSVNEEQSAVLTSTIARICVHIVTSNVHYVCAVPNLCSY